MYFVSGLSSGTPDNVLELSINCLIKGQSLSLLSISVQYPWDPVVAQQKAYWHLLRFQFHQIRTFVLNQTTAMRAKRLGEAIYLFVTSAEHL